MPSIIPPTKGEVRWRSAAYVLVALVGVFVMLDNTLGADGIKTVPGYWSAGVWAALLGTSLIGAVSTWKGRWRVEYVVMPLFGVALAVAVVWGAWNLGAQALLGFEVDWQRAARVASAAALCCLLAARYANLRRLVKAVKAHEPWTLF